MKDDLANRPAKRKTVIPQAEPAPTPRPCFALNPQAVPLSHLHPSPWNPRTISAERFRDLCASIEADPEFLWRRPVLAQADGTIFPMPRGPGPAAVPPIPPPALQPGNLLSRADLKSLPTTLTMSTPTTLRHPYARARRQGQHPADVERRAIMAAFLKAFGDLGNIRLAAQVAGVSRTTIYNWRDRDVDGFKEKFRYANLDVDDMLEGELLRRGFRGWDEPVYQGGKKVGTIRKYSDRLLELLVKARMPAKYRERAAVEWDEEKEIERLAAVRRVDPDLVRQTLREIRAN